MDTDLLALVAGQTIDPRAIRPASITGYWRTGVVGRGYPILLRRAGGHVEGIVVLGLSRRARTRLATYEGSNYRLMPATVESGGRTVSAVVFMFVGSGSGLRSDLRSWSLDRWRRRWKRRALRRADRLSRRPNDAD